MQTRQVKDEEQEALTRMSVSMPAELLAGLDEMVGEKGLPSRSHAICEMVRRSLTDHAAERGTQVLAGTITFVYSGARSDVRHRIDLLQRRYLKEIISSQHVFLERSHGLEVLLVQAPAERLARMRDEISALKGVREVELTTTARRLPPIYSDAGERNE